MLSVLLVCAAARGAAAGWMAVDLPPPLGSASGCYVQPSSARLADDGAVSATASCSSPGRNRAVLWTGGPWVDLGGLGGDNSQAGGLAAGGSVVGLSQYPDSTYGAFLWNGTMTALPTPPGWNFSFAFGVNTGGTAAGMVTSPSGAQAPVVWSGGQPTVLSLAAYRGYAVGIDDNGAVLINDIDASQDQCESLRLWTPAGETTLVPTRCSGFDADGAGISRHGVVAANVSGRIVRFVPGGTVDLDPAAVVPDYAFNLRTDVTDTGLALAHAAVPLSSPAGAFSMHAFLLTGGLPIDLTETALAPGVSVTAGLDMNERGQILAIASSGPNQDLQLVLLTPVCGDGPDVGQPCDDGNTADTDSCKSDCTPNVCGDGAVRTGVEACDDGGAPGGCDDQCALPPDTATGTVPPGGRVTTDDGVAGATPGDPVQTSVTSPTGGTVTIAETGVRTSPPAGFVIVGTVIDITAPPASVADPLVLEFVLDASVVPAGESAATLTLFRNGAPVPDCPGGLGGGAVPSPCVGLRETLADGDVRLVALTVAASQWAVGVASTCGDGNLDPGEQCDPGADVAGDCCTADCALAPRGAVCRPATAACDVADACDGLAVACPADVRLPDLDADGECDGVDACVGGGAVAGGKLKLSKLGGAAGDEKVSFKGAAPLAPAIDPVAGGVRLLVRTPAGQVVLDATAPGGTFDAATKTGWGAKGDVWKYRGRGAISKVKLVRKQGVLAAKVVGKAVRATAPDDPDLDAVLQLAPAAGGAGPCLEARFAACRVGGGGSTRSCK